MTLTHMNIPKNELSLAAQDYPTSPLTSTDEPNEPNHGRPIATKDFMQKLFY